MNIHHLDLHLCQQQRQCLVSFAKWHWCRSHTTGKEWQINVRQNVWNCVFFRSLFVWSIVTCIDDQMNELTALVVTQIDNVRDNPATIDLIEKKSPWYCSGTIVMYKNKFSEYLTVSEHFQTMCRKCGARGKCRRQQQRKCFK